MRPRLDDKDRMMTKDGKEDKWWKFETHHRLRQGLAASPILKSRKNMRLTSSSPSSSCYAAHRNPFLIYVLPLSHPPHSDLQSHFTTMTVRNHSSFGSEIEFQTGTFVEDGVGVCSPPLWNNNNMSDSNRNENSPLLPYDHCFSHLSHEAWLEKVAEGRRELMEMVKNMSESTYELSLKDIVDEQHSSMDVPEENSIEDRSMSFNSEIQLLQHKNKPKRKNIKSGQITRTASMEKEVFLLKMFIPTSLGMKRKSTGGKDSKVPQKSLCENPEDTMDREWWKKRFLGAGQSKNTGKTSIWGSRRSSGSSGSSSSRSNSNKSRYFFNSQDENLCLHICEFICKITHK